MADSSMAGAEPPVSEATSLQVVVGDGEASQVSAGEIPAATSDSTLEHKEDETSAILSVAQVAALQDLVLEDPRVGIVMNAAANVDFVQLMVKRERFNETNHVFSHRVPVEGRCVTSQLFAALNVLRVSMMKKYSLPATFELSQTYWFYYDKIERANFFLKQIIDTAAEDIGSRLVQHLLAAPMQDGGQWDMIVNLVEKYGVVPKSVFPESFAATASRDMNQVLTSKLREYARDLRCAARDGSTPVELAEMQRKMMKTVVRIVTVCLGLPPKVMQWEFYNSFSDFRRTPVITPQQFYDEWVPMKCGDYVSLIHDPRHEFMKLYTIDRLGNMVGGYGVRYINLPLDSLKQAVRASIDDGAPVWFGCDVGKYTLREKGMLDPELFDLEGLFGTRPRLTKEERLLYGDSLMTHAMVFTAYHVAENGAITKWRVENSYGSQRGDSGYYMMTDEWFGEFTFQVVVHKLRVSADVLAVMSTTPVVLPAWDPMGNLA